MIPIKQKITRKDISWDPKAWRALLKEGWARGGEHWHQFMLANHFTREGAREYNYQPRTEKYQRRKERKYGHRDPLVFSGDLRRASVRVRDVRSTSKGVRIVLHAPKYIYMYSKDSNKPPMAQELGKMVEAEAKKLAELLDRHIQRKAHTTGRQPVEIGGHRANMIA